MRSWVAAVFVAIVVGAAAPAGAAARRVGVMRFVGADELPVRRAVTRVLAAHGVRVVGAPALERAASAVGSRLDEASARRLMKRLGLQALVVGEVQARAGRGASAVLRLHTLTGRPRDVKASVASGPQALGAAIAPALWARAEGALGGRRSRRGGRPQRVADPADDVRGGELASAEPPKPPTAAEDGEDADDTEEDEDEPDADADGLERAAAAARLRAAAEAVPEDRSPRDNPSGGPAVPTAPSGFEVAVGPRFLSRRFTYASDVRNGLSDFQTVTIAPAVAVEATWFPGHRPGDPGYVGLALGYEHGLSLESTTADGRTYQSPNQHLAASGLLRLPSKWLTGRAALGGGWQRFAFAPVGGTPVDAEPPLPDVSYLFVRGGLDLRLATPTPLALYGGMGYRHVLRAGDIASSAWFPRDEVRGVDLTIGVAYRFLPRWELRGQMDVRRYAHDMHARATDAHVAGGAVDVYVSWFAAVVLLFGGQVDEGGSS